MQSTHRNHSTKPGSVEHASGCVERVDPSPESGRGRPGEGKDRVGIAIGRDWWTDAVNAAFATSGLGNEGGEADAVECTIWNECGCAPRVHACLWYECSKRDGRTRDAAGRS